MSGKKLYGAGAIKSDTRYNSEVVEMLINKFMLDGKKTVAQKICYGAIEKAASELNCTPPQALEKAIDNIKPLLEVKSRRVGGATYQVPVEVGQRRGITLSIRWLAEIARAGKGRPISEILFREILSAANGQGAAVAKKETMHKMAEANKAFAHYRW